MNGTGVPTWVTVTTLLWQSPGDTVYSKFGCASVNSAKLQGIKKMKMSYAVYIYMCCLLKQNE